MTDIRFDGTCFNVSWVSSYISLPQFITDFPITIFVEDVNRENKITELYELINGNQ